MGALGHWACVCVCVYVCLCGGGATDLRNVPLIQCLSRLSQGFLISNEETQSKVLNLQTHCLSVLVSEEGIQVSGISKVTKTFRTIEEIGRDQ